MKKIMVLAITLALFSIPSFAAPPPHGGHGPHGGPGMHGPHGRPPVGRPPMGRHPHIHVGIGYYRPVPPVVIPPVGYYRPYYRTYGYYPPYYYPYEGPYYYDGINTAANVINAAAATATAVRLWTW